MESIIEQRASIYDKFRNRKNFLFNGPLLLKFKLDKKSHLKIRKNVDNIIFASLFYFYGKRFKFRKDYLNKYSKYIFNLPNLTPNGILKPRKELLNKFNILHRQYIEVFKKRNLLKFIKKSGIINIRIKKGSNSNKILNRNYSTFKIHSDVWSGLNSDCVMMHHIAGSNLNTIEYFYPQKIKKNILRRFKSYENSKKYYHKAVKVSQLKKREISLCDGLCLHRTMIKTKKNRISCDIPIIFNTKAKRNLVKKSDRYKYYNFKNLKYKKIKDFDKSFYDEIYLN